MLQQVEKSHCCSCKAAGCCSIHHKHHCNCLVKVVVPDRLHLPTNFPAVAQVEAEHLEQLLQVTNKATLLLCMSPSAPLCATYMYAQQNWCCSHVFILEYVLPFLQLLHTGYMSIHSCPLALAVKRWPAVGGACYEEYSIPWYVAHTSTQCKCLRRHGLLHDQASHDMSMMAVES